MIGEEVATTGDPKLNSTFGLRESGAAGTCTISPLCPCLPAHPDPVPTAEKSDRRQRRAWPAQEARRAGGRRAAATPAPPRGRGPTPPASPARASTRRCSLSPRAQIGRWSTSPGPGAGGGGQRRRPERPGVRALLTAAGKCGSLALCPPSCWSPRRVLRIVLLRRRLTGGPAADVAPQAQLLVSQLSPLGGAGCQPLHGPLGLVPELGHRQEPDLGMRKDAPLTLAMGGGEWSKHHPESISASGLQVGSSYLFVLFSY